MISQVGTDGRVAGGRRKEWMVNTVVMMVSHLKLIASWFIRMLQENVFFQMQVFFQASFMGSFTNTG